MKRKFWIQTLTSVLLFGAAWFGLSRVDWLVLFSLKETVVEEKIADAYWELFTASDTFADDDELTVAVNNLFDVLCSSNGLQADDYQVYVLCSNEVNAFAFPGNRLVVTTGLLVQCAGEAELCGVMAHELAHLRKRHVVKKLMKELSVSALTMVLSNGQNTEALGELVRVLSSTAYDRTYEREADEEAVKMLLRAGVDPLPLAGFMQRLADEETSLALLEWVSTHPNSQERCETIKALTAELSPFYAPPMEDTIVGDEDWFAMKQKARERGSRKQK